MCVSFQGLSFGSDSFPSSTHYVKMMGGELPPVYITGVVVYVMTAKGKVQSLYTFEVYPRLKVIKMLIP